MKKTIFILIIFSFIFALPAFAITTDKTVYTHEEIVYGTCSNINNYWGYYDLGTGFLENDGFCDEVYEQSWQEFLTDYWVAVEVMPEGIEICADDGQYENCKASEYFVSEYFFQWTSSKQVINIPFASTSDMLATSGTLFTDIWQIIALATGLPLAFFLIRKVIALI